MLDLKGGIRQACATTEIVTLQILIESMKERSFEQKLSTEQIHVY